MRRLFQYEKYLAAMFVAVIAMIALTAEAYVIHRKLSYFSGGQFCNPFGLTTWTEYAAYIVEAIVYDITFYGTLFLVLTAWFLPRRRWNPAQRCFVAFVLVQTGVAIAVAIKWEILTYFGHKFDVAILRELTNGKLTSAFAWVNIAEFAWIVGLIAVALFIIAVALRALRTLGQNIDTWRPGRWHILCLFILWALLCGNHFIILPFSSLRYGLSQKSSYQAVNAVLERASDFDNDGFGPLTCPADPNNFDSSIQPYAVDVPGNGIDEDGLAGDLEKIDPAAQRPGIRSINASNGMNVILVVVETFRVDAVEMRLDGRPVAPFLDSLRRKHAYTSLAFSNYGVTSRAIKSIFFGSLHYTDKSPSIINVLRRNGYRIYGVSAQNEDWGNTYSLTGLNQADKYYDARFANWDQKQLTTCQKMDKMSLTLSADEVNRRAFDMIDSAAGQPFFMYLNYQDLHYPYYDPSMEKVFIEHPRTDVAFFRPENRMAILRQYGNAAHHLDKAIQSLFAALDARGISNNTMVVIVGDHPDSFYENGVFGHAWTVDEHQKRTPLFVINGRGDYRVPIGQDEIAEIILNTVDARLRLNRLTFSTDRAKRLFVLTGTLAMPRQIAWLSVDDLTTYDFTTNRVQLGKTTPWIRPNDIPDASYSMFKTLVNRWESEHWELKYGK